jgi:thioredoxin-related protein
MIKMLLKQALVAFFILPLSAHSFAQSDSDKEIHWVTFEQAEAAMKQNPKKVIIDVYTDWCGWCKRMDKDVYENDSLIQYVNAHFYAIKFNAEQKKPITFLNKKWEYNSSGRANNLALELMKGKMSYTDLQPLTGYVQLHVMESILKYIGSNSNKTVKWEDWQRDFKPAWPPKKK